MIESSVFSRVGMPQKKPRRVFYGLGLEGGGISFEVFFLTGVYRRAHRKEHSSFKQPSTGWTSSTGFLALGVGAGVVSTGELAAVELGDTETLGAVIAETGVNYLGIYYPEASSSSQIF